MIATPVSKRCKEVFGSGIHSLIGISPFNSYFSVEQICMLAKWGSKYFESFHFFIPDYPTRFTLKALGYSPEKAAHKARRQTNYLRNKITRAMSELGKSKQEAIDLIIDWDKLGDNPVYYKKLVEVEKLFDENREFREGCLTVSKWVLENNTQHDDLGPSDLELAVRYFLHELPLIGSSTEVLNKEKSVFSYHNIPGFLKNLFSERSMDIINPNQGLVIVLNGGNE